MKLSSSILVLSLALIAHTSSATTSRVAAVDFTQTNARFAPSDNSQSPRSEPLKLAPSGQTARIRFESRSLNAAPASDSRSLHPAIVVRAQPRLSPDLHRPAARPASTARIVYPNGTHVVSPEVRRIGRVSRYQNRLSSADAVYVGRTPTLDRSGTARLNRFLFRRSDEPTRAITPKAVRAGAGNASKR